ncbi:hypothetical protein AB3M91_10420 [Solibacillus isronensis]
MKLLALNEQIASKRNKLQIALPLLLEILLERPNPWTPEHLKNDVDLNYVLNLCKSTV